QWHGRQHGGEPYRDATPPERGRIGVAPGSGSGPGRPTGQWLRRTGTDQSGTPAHTGELGAVDLGPPRCPDGPDRGFPCPATRWAGNSEGGKHLGRSQGARTEGHRGPDEGRTTLVIRSSP